jgi:thiamine monophosphate synthase
MRADSISILHLCQARKRKTSLDWILADQKSLALAALHRGLHLAQHPELDRNCSLCTKHEICRAACNFQKVV